MPQLDQLHKQGGDVIFAGVEGPDLVLCVQTFTSSIQIKVPLRDGHSVGKALAKMCSAQLGGLHERERDARDETRR